MKGGRVGVIWIYGAILQQMGAALVASALLAWEVGAVAHILRRLKGTPA
jgi:hypothetical protein